MNEPAYLKVLADVDRQIEQEAKQAASNTATPLAIDPKAEALATAVCTIKAAIDALADDPGASLTEVAQDAWHVIYTDDSAEFERLRKAAKKAGARVTEIDKAIGARNKFSSRRKDQTYLSKYTSQPSQTRLTVSQSLHTNLTNAPKPSQNKSPVVGTIRPDDLIEFSDKSPPRRLIDSQAAEIVADSLRAELRWDNEAGAWLLWRGTHWEGLIKPAEADKILADTIHVGTESLGFRLNYLNGVTQILCRRSLLPPPIWPRGYVPFNNGLLNIATGELIPATQEFSLAWCLPHPYSDSAECPMIKAWLLNAVNNDPETAELLRAWLAALIRGIPLQYLLMLIGSGGSGKSTFVTLASALVGELNMAVSTLRDIEGNRFEAGRIFGKRLLIINEAGKHGGALNMLKAITGSDPIPLERKNEQQSGSFVFEGLAILASNEDLQSTDSTSGLERRRVSVRFDKLVSAEERAEWEAQGGTEQVIHREIPGLIRWCLELTPAEIRERFEHPPQRVISDNLLGMQAGNSVADWLIENCLPESGCFSQVGKKVESRWEGQTVYKNAAEWLYPNYLTWCMESGRTRPVALKKFRSTVVDIARRLGVDVKDGRQPGTGRTCIQGIRLRESHETHFDWSSLQSVKSVKCGVKSCEGNSETTGHIVKDVKDKDELYSNNSEKKESIEDGEVVI
jgi:putative DNA primase/helicase